MNKTLLIIVGVVVVVVGGLLFLKPVGQDLRETVYSLNKHGLSFEYPQTYFVAFEQALNGEREQYAIVLAEDTPEVRELFSDPKSATEGPPTITISIFQNNLDNYTLDSFVKGTNFSNFKLSDGNIAIDTVGGEPAWRYKATGLYENENIVVARQDYVYMFTAFFNSPDDQILKDFHTIIETVTFASLDKDGDIPTSADNAPPGSIHNLPVPQAVEAVKAHVAEKSGIDQGKVIVLTAHKKDWSDSCLGLGGPAESCLFVITPGYEVIIQANGEEQTYRTNGDGSEIRRER